MIAPLILYSPGSFLFFEQYSSSVVVPVIIPLGALLFYLQITHIPHSRNSIAQKYDHMNEMRKMRICD